MALFDFSQRDMSAKHLKYCTSEMLKDEKMRALSIEISSKKYSKENVDVWHCAPSKVVLILGRTTSLVLLESRREMLLGGFGKCGSVIEDHRGRARISCGCE